MYERLEDGRIAFNGNPNLSLAEATRFARGAVQSYFRGKVRKRMRMLHEYGSMYFSWRVTHALKKNSADHRAVIFCRQVGDDYELCCDGAQADEVVRRANAPFLSARPKRVRRPQEWLQQHKLRKLEKQRQYNVARELRREKNRKAASKKKIKKPITPALVLIERNNVVPQLKKSRAISWHEARRAIVHIFKVKPLMIGNVLIATAEERVHSRLCVTLEVNKLQFATRTKDGFTLCFELVTNWRGDLTQLRVMFTDDNKHPLYRRARDYFKKLLIGSEARRERILRPRASDMIKIAA